MNFADKENFTRAMLDVYDVHSKKPDDRTTELYFSLLFEYSLDTVLNALEKCLRTIKFFPKPSDIIQTIDEIAEALNYNIHTKKDDDGSWFDWLMHVNVHDAKYFGHKVEGNQRNQVLSRLKKSGIPDFLDSHLNPGIIKFNKMIDSGMIGKGIINLNELEGFNV